jgi:hypothetical protein
MLPTSCTTVPTSEPDCSSLEPPEGSDPLGNSEPLDGSEPLDEPWLPKESSAPPEPEPAPG